MRRSILSLGLLVMMATHASNAANAAEVKVHITSVDAARKGKLYVQLCEEKDFLVKDCKFRQMVDVSGKDAKLVFAAVPNGKWAAMAFHDENNNGKLDTNPRGIPIEGTAFSRNAKGQYGPPKFADAFENINAASFEFVFRLVY